MNDAQRAAILARRDLIEKEICRCETMKGNITKALVKVTEAQGLLIQERALLDAPQVDNPFFSESTTIGIRPGKDCSISFELFPESIEAVFGKTGVEDDEEYDKNGGR